jgi:hypothetical protein
MSEWPISSGPKGLNDDTLGPPISHNLGEIWRSKDLKVRNWACSRDNNQEISCLRT